MCAAIIAVPVTVVAAGRGQGAGRGAENVTCHTCGHGGGHGGGQAVGRRAGRGGRGRGRMVVAKGGVQLDAPTIPRMRFLTCWIQSVSICLFLVWNGTL